MGLFYWYSSGTQDQIKQLIEQGSILKTELNYYGLTPSETFMGSLDLAKKTWDEEKNKDIIVNGYLNITEKPQPILELEVKNGDFNNLTIEDIRTPEFKIANDLWLYDFIPDAINLNEDRATISLEYEGNYTNFKYDLVNSAFNIYEDISYINDIQFKIIANENFTVNLNRNEIFNRTISKKPETVEQSNNVNSDCSSDKKTAYKNFVESYNEVIKAQQEGDNDAIKMAYDKYNKARACYETFSTNETNTEEY